MSTKGLCEKFIWSADSDMRNELTGYYEPVQPFILLALARRLTHAVFIDAGANIGFYTVVMGCEPSVAEIHAFEPMPEAAAAVRWNAAANVHGKSVEVQELALSDHQGELEFAVVGPLAGDNGALKDSPHELGRIEVKTVPSGRLDDQVQVAARSLLIKIDVEGHEFSLLRGATTILARNQGFMQIEMHDSPARAQSISLLNELGWGQVAKVGPDYYFSNVPEAQSDFFRAAILEEAAGLLREASRGEQRASRRRIATGVYLEVSRSKVDTVKKFLHR